MRRAVALFVGAGLNLCLAFAPLWWLSPGVSVPWPEHLVLALGLTLLLLADATGRGEPTWRVATSVDRRALRLASATGLALLAFVWGALWERSLASSAASAWQIGAGVALMAGGAALRAAAVWQLGGQFVTEVTPAARDRLVRAGIYGTLRHPSETGLLLALAGIALVLDSRWAALAAIPIFATLTWSRLRLEEAALRATFGPSYGEYRRKVGALWPK